MISSTHPSYLTKAELLSSSDSVTGREKLLKLFLDQYLLTKFYILLKNKWTTTDKRRLSTDSTPTCITFVVVRLYQPVCPNVPAIVRLYQLSDQRQSSEGLSTFLSYFRDKIVLKHILNNISIYMSFEMLHCMTWHVPRKSLTRECPNVPTLTHLVVYRFMGNVMTYITTLGT